MEDNHSKCGPFALQEQSQNSFLNTVDLVLSAAFELINSKLLINHQRCVEVFKDFRTR